eukprot:scaffold24531_cov122-Cylindrotheca_fusiformis.AAC.4
MESLDDFLESLHVNLEPDGEKESRPTNRIEESQEADRRQETFTDSILRDDFVAPNIVHFTSTYGNKNRNRKLAIIFLVLVFSVSSLYRFSRMVVPLFQEVSKSARVKEIESSNSTPPIID